MKITFSSIKNGTIFNSDFQHLANDNGTIKFKHNGNNTGGIAVVYAPNGTGKSSLARVLETDKESEDLSFSATDEKGNTITVESNAFHIIHDQIDRNIIPGEETDYLVGKQIRKEYELRAKINAAFSQVFSGLNDKYKKEFKVTKVSDFFLKKIDTLKSAPYLNAHTYLKSIINRQDHGKNIERDEFVRFIRNKENDVPLVKLDDDKRKWIVEDCSGKTKIAECIIKLDYKAVKPDEATVEIERHDDAIHILEKYSSLDKCVVCDNQDFDGKTLLKKKTANRQRIYDSLDKTTKDLLEKVVNEPEIATSDPFDIKRIVSAFIANGDSTEFLELREELDKYVNAVCNEMVYAILHCFDNTEFFNNYDEFNNLISMKPEFDSDELLFIKDVINENIGKNVSIERDEETKNYKLKLGDKDLLNTERTKMELSTGEQNFISLAFELLLARHSQKEYVVLDDPISSFDSIYKNKIAYCIIKFLENKKQIVLTHNTDLIRLLEVQKNSCFNLYILNNVENGKNGFISVNEEEKKILINLHELVKLFQNKDNHLVPAIKNRRQFLMSVIPFLRGYAHITLDEKNDFGALSGIMHGYETGCLDIIPIYERLFGYKFEGHEIVSVDDVLNVDCRILDIIDSSKYPLLADTLKQTLIYYHLRMKVEKELVDDFKLSPKTMDTLNQIIMKAFNCNESDPDFKQKQEFRVFFTSRKTLLNEFNHFEGNINIFQPAIDITQSALEKEMHDIETALEEVKKFANKVN